MEKTLLSQVVFFLIALNLSSQDLKIDFTKAYMASVYKQDKSFIDVGILWDAKDDELLLLPKSQFRQLKNKTINQLELKFIQINSGNLKRLKLFRSDKKSKSFFTGLGIGVGLGIPIGIIRSIGYDEELCEETVDPLWTKCVGGKNRVRNNIITWGMFGGFVGFIHGSVKINIDLKGGKESYDFQKAKIKKYTILK